MRIIAKFYGEMEINELKQVYRFKRGIPAFEYLKEWALIPLEQEPFFLMQSLEEKEIAFFLLDPWLCRKDYEVKLEEGDLHELSLIDFDRKKVLVLSIISLASDHPSGMTMNLQAPILFNQENLQAVQAILNDARWQVRHNLQEELERSGTDSDLC